MVRVENVFLVGRVGEDVLFERKKYTVHRVETPAQEGFGCS